MAHGKADASQRHGASQQHGASILTPELRGLCHAFEAAWVAKRSPLLEEFLARVPEAQQALFFEELLRLELFYRKSRGEQISTESLLARFPSFAECIREALSEASQTEKWSQAPVDSTNALNPIKQRRAAIVEEAIVGQRFGDYEIRRFIARGGMGVVYEAWQTSLKRPVALKMIRSAEFAHQEEVDRFFAEARAAGRLLHPGIVPVFEVGTQAGRHFFSMEYIEGQSLMHKLRAGPLPAREAAELVRQVAAAVEFAHSRGVIHRDLKPQNILLDASGHPRVTDFGLAKQLTGDDAMTATGQILGTPSYMPPEQASGKLVAVSRLSDVYSLGAVLYALVTGRPPFQAGSPIETLQQVLTQEPVSPRMLNPAVPRDLETIALKCLSKDASRRYASAAKLAEDLGHFLDGKPILARPAGHIERTIRWCRRNPLAAALVCSLFLLLVAVAGFSTVALRARRVDHLSTLERLFETRLKDLRLNEDSLRGQEQLVDEIDSLDHPRAVENRKALWAAAAAMIRGELDAERLTDERRTEISAEIQLLTVRDAGLAADLSKALTQHFRDWHLDWELAPPFANAQSRFAATPVTVNHGELAYHSSTRESPMIALKADSSQATEVVVEFSSNWEAATSLGVLLQVEGDAGYELLVQPTATSGGRDELAGRVALKSPISFTAARGLHGTAVIMLRRRNLVLQQTAMPLDQLHSKPLRLRLRREYDELIGQVDGFAPLRASDPFPLIGEKGICAVRWPSDIGLSYLAVLKKEAPPRASPLEIADARYDRGDFDSALQAYSQEALRESSPQRDEARYKQALCLLARNRLDDAADVLESLRWRPGERWPAMAGCQLWLLRLKQNRETDATEVFDSIQSRFSTEQLAALISGQDRELLTSRYLSGFLYPTQLLRFDPNRLARVEKTEKVLRLLSNNGALSTDNLGSTAELLLGRAYEFSGKPEQALEHYHRYLLSTSERAPRTRHYYRVLRLLGKSQQALDEIQQDLLAHPPEPDASDYAFLLLEKVRTRIALRHSSADIEAEIAHALHVLDTYSSSDEVRSTVRGALLLIRGLRYDARGDEEAARAAWKEGFAACHADMLRYPGNYRSTEIHELLLGALSGDLSDEDADHVLGMFTSAAGDSPIVLGARTFLGDPQALNALQRAAWQSPRGRRLAWDLVTDALPQTDSLVLPTALLGMQYVQDSAFASDWRAEQEEVVYQSSEEGVKGMMVDGSISFSKLLPLVLAWKGIGTTESWVAAFQQLPADLPAGGLYVLAHRLSRRHAAAAQIAAVFEAAAKSAPKGSPLADQIAVDRQLLASNQGQIAVVNKTGRKLKLSLRRSDRPDRALEVDKEAAADLDAGEYAISLPSDATDILVTKPRIRIDALERAVVEIVDAQRFMAAWVLARHGTLKIALKQQAERLVLQKSDLPAGGFRILAISLPKQSSDPWDLKPAVCLKNISELTLRGSGVTNRDLVAWSEASELRRLTLVGTVVDDAGVESIAKLSGLKALNISGTSVSALGMASLNDLSELEELTLNASQATAGTLKRLAEFPRLARITLSGTKVNDEVCERVTNARLPRLTTLQLQDTSVSDSCVERLKLAIPALAISKHNERDPPAKLAASGPRSASRESLLQAALRPGGDLNLLSVIDPKLHRVAGDWNVANGVLIGAAIADAKAAQEARDRLVIPVEPRGSYRLTARFTRSKCGPNKSVGFVLPVGRGRTMLVFDHHVRGAAGLDQVDGNGVGDSSNPNVTTKKPGTLEDNHAYDLEAIVRIAGNNASIEVRLDGRPYLSWKGAQSSLNMFAGWDVPNGRGLGIAKGSAELSIEKLRLTMLDGMAEMIDRAK
ncbi:MAG TPA: serine/threonine-protein kinase [Pirellulales bacterium]|nr:serine/threonine-protein kinase [Pirellulales bacterium]